MKTACFSDSYVREKAGGIYPGSYEVEAHTYDANGNRLTLTQNGDVYRYTYGMRNRLESIEKKGSGEDKFKLFTSYTYDANGNTIKRTIYKSDDNIEETMFEYDTMNRVVKTTNHLFEETLYFYDNAGNRYIKEDKDGTTLYLRHGQIAVAMDIEVNKDQTEEKGKINRYVLSGDLIAGRVTTTVGADDTPVIEKSYYHLDHLNSTKMVTDDTGTVEVNYTYRAFGEQLKRLDADSNEVGDEAKYSYGGKELDDGTNLYYFNARYYDATTGRFISVDPIFDGSNWYIYCANNPMAFIDPTGLDWEKNEDGSFTATEGDDYLIDVYKDAGYDTWQEAAEANGISDLWDDNGNWAIDKSITLEGFTLLSKESFENMANPSQECPVSQVGNITAAKEGAQHFKFGVGLKGAVIIGIGIEAGIVVDSEGSIGLYGSFSIGTGMQLGEADPKSNALRQVSGAMQGAGASWDSGTIHNAAGVSTSADAGALVMGTWDIDNKYSFEGISGFGFGGGVWKSFTGVLPIVSNGE